MLIQGALALILGFGAAGASAASFDCSKASSWAEKEICRDGYLTTADNILAQSYKKALAASSSTDSLRQSQREWLAVRDHCTEQNCLDKAIGDRIHALDAIASAEETKAYDAKVQAVAVQQAAEQAKQDKIDAAAQAVRAEEDAQYRAKTAEVRARMVAAQRDDKTYVPAPLSAYTGNLADPDPGTYAEPKNPVGTWFFLGPGWKYLLLLTSILSAWAVFRHHRGAATIYNDYTDALITNAFPAAGIAIAILAHWLEMAWWLPLASISIGLVISATYSIYASVKSNRGGLSILLTIIAKLTLVTVFFIVIAMLIASLFLGSQRKGESRARAATRHRREAKSTIAGIAAMSAGYTALTIWLCRTPVFTPISVCLEFKRPPRLP